MKAKREHRRWMNEVNSQLRRETAKRSLWAFAYQYLGDVFGPQPSRMHTEMADMLQQAAASRNQKLLLTGPYGYRQCELVALAYTLWGVCNEIERFILILGDDTGQAKDSLHMIKHALERNPLIRADFPEASGKNTGNWTSTGIVTRNGVTIRAAGLNQRVHRFRYNGQYPSLIVINVPDDHYTSFSLDDLAMWSTWFTDLLERNCDVDTNVVAVGTFCQIPFSLLGEVFRLKEFEDWKRRRYSAVLSESSHQKLWHRWELIYTKESKYFYQDGSEAAKRFFDDHEREMLEGAASLWPEYESYYELMEFKVRHGDEKFQSRKGNMPVGYLENKKRRERIRRTLEAFEAELEKKDISR